MKRYKLKINGEHYEAKILSYTADKAKVNVNGVDYEIDIEQENIHLKEPQLKSEKSFVNPGPVPVKTSDKNGIIAPIPGIILEVHKKVGDYVDAGTVIFTVEAMKMESELVAQVSGKISEINTEKGKSVLEGDVLAVIEGLETEQRPASKPDKKKSSYNKQTSPSMPKQSSAPSDGSIRAPIPGTVLEVRVNTNDHVNVDDVVIILEAMKMESEIRSHVEGNVKSILVAKGDSVQENDVLIELGD
jgi:glutaconyl-CoA/methylmalonyl-CoA decarboxylase subunit gamma